MFHISLLAVLAMDMGVLIDGSILVLAGNQVCSGIYMNAKRG